MQRIESTWLGLATLGVFTVGCPETAPGGDDELGESTTSTEGDTTGSDTTEGSEDSTDTTTDNGDFQLIEAALADDYVTLVLTFSDAVAPVDGVDPSDFRISMAMTMSGAISYYVEPNYYIDEYAAPIGMMALSQGPGSDQISVMLAPVFDMEACAALEYAIAHAQGPAEGHFFVHYAPGDIPLTSEDGIALGPIGPDWVLTSESSSYVGTSGWPNLDPQVPIPCP